MAISPTVRPRAVDEAARTGIPAPAARETRRSTVVTDNQFHPDWDQIKPFNDRIAELEKVAKQALEALKGVIHAHGYNGGTPVEAITALRQSLEQGGTLINDGTKGPQQEQTDWEAVAADQAMTIAMLKTEVQEIANKQEPVAWLVYTLDGGSVFVTDNPSDFTDEHRALPLYTSPPAQQEPVANGLPLVIAGAIFDFAGYLTTRDTVIEVGSTANASPVADLVKDWATLRGLSLADAAVLSWQEWLTDVRANDTSKERVDEMQKQRHDTTPPQPASKPWVGLTEEDVLRIKGQFKGTLDVQFDKFAYAIEAKLREKNGGGV